MSGQRSYLAGLSAEDQVALWYKNNGADILSRRWRGSGGEIDLIAHEGNVLIFIEVKHSKSHTSAAANLSPAQIGRLQQTAEEYLATTVQGSLQNIRFDVALVDQHGKIEIIKNAFL